MNLKKWGKEKDTFVEVGKLLEDSCRRKYAKLWSSKSTFEAQSCSNFEQCSNVCVGRQKFCFFYERIVGVRKVRGEQSDFVESA